MIILISIICIICFAPLIFILIYLRPLTKDEIKQLAMKRRDKQINSYFVFNRREFNADKEFKKNMRPDGSYYKVKENLFDFPSIAGALLKYKKHEWAIIAFEKNQQINLLWLNKGYNRTEVPIYMSAGGMVYRAKEEGQKSILIFHNHPNPNPGDIIITLPSKNDISSAKEFAGVFNQEGINLLEFICERGGYYKYFQSIADSFYPLTEFIEVIDKENNLSKLKNLSLHFERIF